MKKNWQTETKKVGQLYVVICIDAEGPTKGRLNSWKRLDDEVSKLFSKEIRNAVLDSRNKGLLLNWFIMDWTGFKENPHHKTLGYGQICDYYKKKHFNSSNEYGARDEVYWHYHHPPSDGKWVNGGWNKDWLGNEEYYNQLNHLIIDRKFFPNVFRAGGVIETNEMSNWLEQWIPFDYSNRSPLPNTYYYLKKGTKNAIKETAKFVLGYKEVYLKAAWKELFIRPFKKPLWDWSRAPKKWGFYHPNLNNYQNQGNMKRIIFRCLDINSPAYQLCYADIESAFKKAALGQDTILACSTHDNSINLSKEILYVIKLIKKASFKYNNVTWVYTNALDAAQGVLKCKDKNKLRFELFLMNDNKLYIKSNKPLFGPSPYVAIKYDNDGYAHYSLEKVNDREWVLELVNLDFSGVIGVGGSDIYGNTDVAIYSYQSNNDSKRKESKWKKLSLVQEK